MKLTKLAPVFSLVALIAGSSAFAQDVRFNYAVGGGCGNVLTQSAVVAAPTCGASAVVAAPACASACGPTGYVSPAVIDVSGNACDPYLPLWQQAVIDHAGMWGTRVCGLPQVAEIAPCTTMTNAAVIESPCGAVMTQPAVIQSGCGAVIEQRAVVNTECAPQVINQPVFIQGVDASDIRLIK